MFHLFKKKKSDNTTPDVMPGTQPAEIRSPANNSGPNYSILKANMASQAPVSLAEPWTLAQARLTGGAKDVGAWKARPMYNAHTRRLQNQWINPLESVNSGYGTVHNSVYLYQPVNYYECYSLAQDPLFAKVFNLLSQTPFAKGGNLVLPDDSGLDMDQVDAAAKKYGLWRHIISAVRSEYVTGGCLLYLDFGLSQEELSQPLDLTRIKMSRFRGFRHIDPINCVPIKVDTINPAAADYMNPTMWYVIGIGTVHHSHFLKFEANIPELVMRPMTLYFGMPLTQLIKQDVANSNLASQSLANLMGRFRYIYMKTDPSAFVTNNGAQLRDKLEFMSLAQDNFGVCPLRLDDDVMQLTTTLAGMDANVELFYLLVSAKTNIPFTELMGKSAQGMDATGTGDRRKWYDTCRTIQSDTKDNILVAYGIVAGTITGHYVKFPDYVFNPLEESSEKERAENIRSYAEVARTLIDLGGKQSDVFEWLKSFKEFHLDNIALEELASDLDDYPDDGPNGGGMLPDVFGMSNADWKESDHPRDKDGKFADTDEAAPGSARADTSIPGVDRPADADIYINVPYHRKDLAKSVGAKWNPDRKSWYIPAGTYHKDFAEYMESIERQAKKWSKRERKEFTPKAVQSSQRELSDGYQAVQETPKAVLLEKDGIEFWVKKQWVRADGTLTPAVAKAHKAAVEQKNIRDADAARLETLEHDGVPFTPSWESDKAVGIDVDIDFYDAETNKRMRLFFPKSIVNDRGNIPYWFVQKKIQEMEETLSAGRSRMGGYSYDINGLDFSGGQKSENTAPASDTILYIHSGEIYEIDASLLSPDDDPPGGRHPIDNAWRESDHPRAPDGKFGTKDTGAIAVRGNELGGFNMTLG